MISTSPNKEKEARERLGADHFIVSKDDKAMAVRQSAAPSLLVTLYIVATPMPLSGLCCSAVLDGFLAPRPFGVTRSKCGHNGPCPASMQPVATGGSALAGRNHRHGVGQARALAAAAAAGRRRHARAAGRAHRAAHFCRWQRAVQPVRVPSPLPWYHCCQHRARWPVLARRAEPCHLMV